jgi:hypothetical protein
MLAQPLGTKRLLLSNLSGVHGASCTALPVACSSDSSPAEQIDYKNYQPHDQQNVNQSAADVKAET